MTFEPRDILVRFGRSRTGGEPLDLMPEKLDQVALAVRNTLVLIGTHREGSNFRPLRYHASAGAIFQKARTRPALTMPAVRYGSLRQAATWASAVVAGSALPASIWISARPIGTMFSHRWKVLLPLPFASTDCIHMSIMPSLHFRAANIGSIVQRKE